MIGSPDTMTPKRLPCVYTNQVIERGFTASVTLSEQESIVAQVVSSHGSILFNMGKQFLKCDMVIPKRLPSVYTIQITMRGFTASVTLGEQDFARVISSHGSTRLNMDKQFKNVTR